MSFKAQGSFCWTDMITKNATESKDFYSKVFGWHWEEAMPGTNPYYTGHWGNETVTGLATPEVEIPQSHWSTYFYTNDIDHSIKQALDLGATTHMGKKDIPEWGSLAVMEDPSGAVFSFWNSLKEAPQEAYANGRTGHMCWTELMTTDIEKAGKFYCDLFGWTPAPMSTPSGDDYFIFNLNDQMNCGMMEINPKTMGNTPSHWLNYVTVDSASVTLKRATDLGAQKLWGIQHMENVGYLAIFQDPQGAVIGLNGKSE